MKEISIYLHVPFCVRKCDYCDFASFAGREDRVEDYFAALRGEIDAWADLLRTRTVRSVFFGGGTPSLPEAKYICDALSRLREYAAFAPDAEITIEANPGTVDEGKLAAYRISGVNRISFGVQSLDANLLSAIGRIHDPRQAVEAVGMAKGCGFDNISVDLMYALPGQSMDQWRETLSAACELPITHVSAYSLILEEGTRLHDRVRYGAAVIPDDDAVNDMQRMAVHMLADRGFARYEISNFALPGMESRHNMNYWLGGDYLGLGSAAHSLVDDVRFANPADMEAYIRGERMIDRAPRTRQDRMEEAILLQTRTVRGLDLAEWKSRFGEDLLISRRRALEKLVNYDMIEIEGNYLRLTPVGLEMQDSVVLELM